MTGTFYVGGRTDLGEIQPKRASQCAPRIAAAARDRFDPRPTWGKEFSPNPFSRGPPGSTVNHLHRLSAVIIVLMSAAPLALEALDCWVSSPSGAAV
jgi:hypothetical protein